MDAARSLVFTNLAIALLTSIYVFAIIAICLIPEPNGKELEVSKHFANQIVSVRVELL